jgi:hypothetical protein
MRDLYECGWCYEHFNDRDECVVHELTCFENPVTRACDTCHHLGTVVADTGKVWNTCAVGLLTSSRWVENRATKCPQWSHGAP